MQFVNPLFLIALSALAIPILIHLFNFRRYKKVFFTNVRFLREIQQETKKQSQLRQLLILLARLLAIAALVFAFAQPYLRSSQLQKKITRQQAVSIYLDNSFSMEALATDGKLLDVAKKHAITIAEAYAPSDLFQLITNDFEGRHQRLVSQDEFRKLVAEVQISPVSRFISEVVIRQNDLLAPNLKMNKDAYLVSDFQKNTASLLQSAPDTAITWFLVPLVAEKQNNLFVDTAYFFSPVHQSGQPVSMRIRIHNASGEALEKIPVKLTLNSVQKAVSSFSVEANSTTEVTLPYTENAAGIQYGLIELVDYPVVYDDKFYFSYQVLPSIPAMSINERDENSYLNALFENDSTIHFSNSQVRQLDYGRLFSNAIIFLNGPEEISSGLMQELNRYVRGGGSLVVFPPATGTIGSYNSMLALMDLPGFTGIDTVRQRIAWLNVESALYNDVFEKNATGRVVLPENIDLPVVQKHYILQQGTHSGAEVLVRLQNQHPFLITAPVEKGKVYIFSAPADDAWTMFPKHMIFVPTLYKIALLSNPLRPLYYLTGENSRIEIPADSIQESNLYKIRKLDSGYEVIPEIKKAGTTISLLTHDQIRDAGHYSITRGDQPAALVGLAFNYNRDESDLSCFSATELEQQIGRLPAKDIHILREKKTSIATEISQIRQGTPLWKYFILLAMVFIAFEIALIRLMKS